MRRNSLQEDIAVGGMLKGGRDKRNKMISELLMMRYGEKETS